MTSSKQQTGVKETNRNKILRILEAKGATLKELQIETGLTPPAVINHLKKMEDEGIVECLPAGREANKRRRFEYVLTTSGKKREEQVRASVAKAYQIIMKTLPSNHPAKATLSDLSDLAESDPKFFNELGQWISDYMALVTSEKSRQWIYRHGKSGADHLQSELTKRTAPLMQDSQPLNADKLIAVLKILLNGTRETIAKG